MKKYFLTLGLLVALIGVLPQDAAAQAMHKTPPAGMYVIPAFGEPGYKAEVLHTCRLDSNCKFNEAGEQGTCIDAVKYDKNYDSYRQYQVCAVCTGSTCTFGRFAADAPPVAPTPVKPTRYICETDNQCIEDRGPEYRCVQNAGAPIKECIIPGSRPTQSCDRSTECPSGQECMAGIGVNGRGACMVVPRDNAPLVNLLKVDTLEELIALVMQVVVQIGSILMVLALVWVGFQFVAAQGNEEKIRSARDALTWTVIGGLMLLGAQALSLVIQATVESL